MKLGIARSGALAVALCMGRCLAGAALDAQSPGGASSNRAGSAVLVPPPPPVPSIKSPIDFFRELLLMPPGERKRVLAGRTAESQKLIAAKLEEYDALAPDQRELRLRVTELRYYLRPLMALSQTNRESQLSRVPAQIRPLVQERLYRWDKLTPDQQKAFLHSEDPVPNPAAFAAGTNTVTAPKMTNMPPVPPMVREAAILRWRQLTDQQRLAAAKHFEEYFELTEPERAKILSTLSESEIRQIRTSLRTFDRLDPVRRGQCVRALEKLARLRPDEEQEFLKNAERWAALSPAERKAWRDLVHGISHPPIPPPPPRPALPKLLPRSPSIATN